MKQDTNLLTGSTRRLFEEFGALGIECEAIAGQTNLMRYRTRGGKWLYVKNMVSENLPVFSYIAAADKWWTYQILAGLNLPTPDTLLYSPGADLQKFINKYRKVVVKPRSGAHGYGVSLNISSSAQLQEAVSRIKVLTEGILIQEQVEGPDIRMLIIGGKLVSALERIPAAVIGDGVRSVRALIRIENSPARGRGIAGIDKLIKIPEAAVHEYLSPAQLDAIPKKGEVVRVVGPSNHSLGGTISDAMQALGKTVVRQAELVAKHLQMPISGVDCVITNDGPKFIEINASPGIGIHDDNLVGVTSGCFKAYAQLLYEQDA